MTPAPGELQAVHAKAQPVRVGPYRMFVAALFAALVATLAALAIFEGLPPPELLALFAALVVVAENRDRLFGDETSISGSIAVAVASVVAFRESAPFFGPLACAACAGIYWPHVRERSFDKVIVNASSIGFSALAAAGALEVLAVDRNSSAGDLLVLAIPVVVVYWLVNTCVLAIALSFLRGSDLRRSVLLLVRSETSMLGFALAGGLCGLLFLRHGHWVGAASIILLLVFLDVLVISPRRWPAALVSRPTAARAYAHVRPLLGAAMVAFFWAERVSAPLAACAAIAGALVVAFFVALVGVHRRIGIWDRHLALGVAIADAPLVVVFAVGGALAATVGIWIALAAVSAALAIGFVVLRRRRRLLAEAAQDDVRLAAAVELAVLDSRDRSSSSR